MLFCNRWVSAKACDARHIVKVRVSYKLIFKFSVMGYRFERIDQHSRVN